MPHELAEANRSHFELSDAQGKVFVRKSGWRVGWIVGLGDDVGYREMVEIGKTKFKQKLIVFLESDDGTKPLTVFLLGFRSHRLFH